MKPGANQQVRDYGRLPRWARTARWAQQERSECGLGGSACDCCQALRGLRDAAGCPRVRVSVERARVCGRGVGGWVGVGWGGGGWGGGGW